MGKPSKKSTKKVLRFCYDIICPYAYLASLQVESIAKRCNATLEYVPVLLGGIYQANQAPQGKNGSASQAMSLSKRKIVERDLARMAWRNGVVTPLKGRHHLSDDDHNGIMKINTKDNYHRISLQAMRILTAAEGDDRRQLTNLIYSAFWQDGRDIRKDVVLREIVQTYFHANKNTGGAMAVSDHTMGYSKETSLQLRQATTKAVSEGAFGVPTFFIATSMQSKPQLVFGFDRLFFVERLLGRKNTIPLRLQIQPNTNSMHRLTKKLTFYYDLSSPWAFVANQRLRLLLKQYSSSSSNIDIQMEYVPILLGALFKQLGTANAPLLQLSPNKRANNSMELDYWQNFLNEQQLSSSSPSSFQNTNAHINAQVKWPKTFPIRTVTPLRCVIQNPNLRNGLYEAAWQQQQNIGDTVTLFQVLVNSQQLSEHDASTLIRSCKNNQDIKQVLFDNTRRAFDNGVIGVPSFQVDHGEVIFGQDRLNVVEDLLNGWIDASDPTFLSKSKL